MTPFLYAYPSPNSKRITLALTFLNVEHSIKHIDLINGEHFSEEYKKINPHSKVPAYVDTDPNNGNEITLTESAAIVLFLFTKYDKKHEYHYSETDEYYSEQLRWSFFAAASLQPTQDTLLLNLLVAPVKNEAAIEAAKAQVAKIYTVLNQTLKNNNGFFVGSKLNVADFLIYPHVKASSTLGLDLQKEYPAVAEYLKKLDSIDGFEKGFNAL